MCTRSPWRESRSLDALHCSSPPLRGSLWLPKPAPYPPARARCGGRGTNAHRRQREPVRGRLRAARRARMPRGRGAQLRGGPIARGIHAARAYRERSAIHLCHGCGEHERCLRPCGGRCLHWRFTVIDPALKGGAFGGTSKRTQPFPGSQAGQSRSLTRQHRAIRTVFKSLEQHLRRVEISMLAETTPFALEDGLRLSARGVDVSGWR
jgi:hypothetical protein